MGVSRERRDRIRELLEPLGPVVCHRLFGGVGLYRGARLFGILHRDRLFLRVDEQTLPVFERHGMGPFRPYADRPPATRYYEAPPGVLDSTIALREWCARAIAAAEHDPPKRPRSRSRKTPLSES